MNQRKQQRIEEAKERQAAYDSLTLEQKILLCASRRGTSKREMAKLLAKRRKLQEAKA
jgi:hypothetical protein